MEKHGSGFWELPPAGPRKLRRFGLMIGGVLSGVAGWEWYEGGGMSWGLGGLGGLFLLGGVFAPATLRPVYSVWMYAARILGWINSHLLLGLVFYTLFTLVGMIMRLVGYDPLDRRLEPERRSYWSKRDITVSSRDHYERQF